jgi:hypothetical protein
MVPNGARLDFYDAPNFTAAVAEFRETGRDRRLRRREPVPRMLLEMAGRETGNEVVGLRGMGHDFSRGEIEDHRLRALGAAVDSKVKYGNR